MREWLCSWTSFCPGCCWERLWDSRRRGLVVRPRRPPRYGKTDFRTDIFRDRPGNFLKGECFMNSLAKILSVLVLAVVMMPSANPAAPGGGPDAFEKLKALVGHWEEQQPSAMKQTLDIQLTSGGSVVMERSSMVQDGAPVEMITMYYLDGDQVKMTHYCEARNQPTMRGTYLPETKTLTFDF